MTGSHTEHTAVVTSHLHSPVRKDRPRLLVLTALESHKHLCGALSWLALSAYLLPSVAATVP